MMYREDQEHHRQEAEELFKTISRAIPRDDPAVVEGYFRQILSMPIPADIQDRALFEFASYLDTKKANLTKAAAVYEQILTLNPSTPQAPFINLRLAEIYRQMGANKRSLNRLYEVLTSAIRSGSKPSNEEMVRQAMLKIGNVHFEAGQYEQAAKIYSRLKLLELPRDDQAAVLYRAADLLFRMQKYEAAIEAGREVLSQFPNSEFVYACKHLIIESLQATGKQDEAIQETVDLLQSSQSDKDSAMAAYWKIRTGNDLANVLYSNKEYARALRIYQTIAGMNKDVSWNLQTVYQIGHCFEQLREYKRAIEAYKYIGNAKIPAGASSKSEAHIAELKEAAAWRAKHLEWMVETGTKLYPILAPKIRAAAQLPPKKPAQ